MMDPTFWSTEREYLLKILFPLILKIAEEGIASARRKAAEFGLFVDTELIHLAALEWATKYTDTLLSLLGTTSEKIVGEILARWIKTPGMTMGQLVEMLTPRFSDNKVRADLIAVTEVTRAFAEGEALVYEKLGIGRPALIPPGHPGCRCWTALNSKDGKVYVVWMTENDHKVCQTPIQTPWGIKKGCQELHGMALTGQDAGLKKHLGPGRHPNGSPQSVHSGDLVTYHQSTWPYTYYVDPQVFNGNPEDPEAQYASGYQSYPELMEQLPLPEKPWEMRDEEFEYVWRSMSGYEFEKIRETGWIQSTNSMSFADQKGMTFYSSTPSSMYAEDNFKQRVVQNHIQQVHPDFPYPDFGQSAYIIGVRNSPAFQTNRQREFYTTQPLSSQEILFVIEVRPGAVNLQGEFSTFGYKLLQAPGGLKKLFKGEAEGHPFRGNQYVEGIENNYDISESPVLNRVEKVIIPKGISYASYWISPLKEVFRVKDHALSAKQLVRSSEWDYQHVENLISQGWIRVTIGRDELDLQTANHDDQDLEFLQDLMNEGLLPGNQQRLVWEALFDSVHSIQLEVEKFRTSSKVQRKPAGFPFLKGESAGHPFRGNQYVSVVSEIEGDEDREQFYYEVKKSDIGSILRSVDEETPTLEEDSRLAAAQEIMAAARDFSNSLLVSRAENGKILGAASYEIRDETLYINHIGSIRPDTGSKLIQTLEEIAKSHSLSLVLFDRIPALS